MPQPSSAAFVDYYTSKPYRYEPQILRRDSIGAQGAAFLLVEQPRGEFPDPPMDEMLVQMCVRGAGWQRADLGAGYFESAFTPKTVSLTVPGQATDYVLDNAGAFAVLVIPEPVHRRARVALTDDKPVDFGGLHSTLFHHHLTELLFRSLLHRNKDDIADPVLGEAMIVQAVAWLIHISGGRLASVRATLGPRRLAQAIDYLIAHMSDQISLEDLAAAAGASPFHFLRDFKKTFGETPFQYLSRRRAEHAESLLRETSLPLTEIALACGYASQSHFTTAFRKFSGHAPAAFRRSLK